MKFSEVIDQAAALLERKKRLSYRALKREFELDDSALEDLKHELIEIQELAVDKDGKMLVWVGESQSAETLAQPQPPASYTPSHLAERILAEQAAMEKRGAMDGERKTITALFADLKGSTALIEGLDPEEARAIIDPALQLMMDAVHRYDGYVAQALGDGIFALFGAPIAHEDHPQRALYSALQLQDKMRGYSDELRRRGQVPLQTRVGVNTGEVVVRSIRKDDLHTDYVPVGHSTNIAARMEQLANPGSILVTAQTHKFTDGYFEFKALGDTQVKGVEEPLDIYELLGVGPLRTRFDVAARRGLSRFVGRQSELDQMQQALAQAKAGHGQIVGVMGEPGLGKSRLFYEFKLSSGSGCLVLEAFSVSHGKPTPYLPVIELLKTYFQIKPGDDERIRRERVIGRVLALDRSLEDTLPYLLSLLGLEGSPSSLQQMDAQIRRQRTFDALKRLFLRESLNQPLTVIFEDLHWIDNETQGILDTLSESVASARILLLVNYRPEYRHDWGGKTYYTQLRLAPLGQEEAKELLAFLLGNDTTLKDLKRLILERTEGTPFFMEEVVLTLAEEGVLLGERGNYQLQKAPTELHISATVQGVLAARIDRLEPAEKALLQQLSVIGREFPLGLVRAVVTQSEDELHRLLSSLQRKEFLYEQPAFPEVEYIFKHALTREVAYGTVLHEQRKALHECTAEAMEALYPDSLEDHYGDLAHHYSRSDNIEKAIAFLRLAGQRAVQRSANVEAIGHFTTALEMLQTLPDTSERAQQELMLLMAVGAPLQATKGWSAAEVQTIYTRARELCQQVGETPQAFPMMWGLWVSHFIRAELQTAKELGEQLIRLAQSAQDPVLLLEAHHAQWSVLVNLGELTRAREHYEQGIALYDPEQHRALAFVYGGHDAGSCALSFGATALWLLGYPDQAREKSDEALTLAREINHPISLALTLWQAARLHQHCREDHLAQELAQAGIALSDEQGFGVALAWASVIQGWTLAEQGQAEEGIAQIRQGDAAYRATGAEMGRSHHLALLAQGYGKGGQPQEGLAVVAEALDFVVQTGEVFYEAELQRLKGQLTLEAMVGSPDSHVKVAQDCFQQALDIARRQQAKSLELRAATSLARLWQRQGKRENAHQLLSEIYNWFTEGFDTKDLQEAQVLLEEMA